MKSFPGTIGNPFDLILRKLEKVEQITILLFFPGILLFSLVMGRLDGLTSLCLLGFICLDWLFVAALPGFKKSFGPVKPVVLQLAILRGLVMLILPFLPSLVLQVIGTALLIWGFWIEPHTIQVTHQTYETEKIPTGQVIHLLQISDLHIEKNTRRENQLSELIQTLRPDLICFTGDILNLSYLDNPTAHNQARDVLSKWHAPQGIFAVSGSPAVDLPDIFDSLIAGTNVHRLNNTCAVVQKKDGPTLNILGVTCSHVPHQDVPTAENLLSGVDADHLNILLYHSPDVAPALSTSGIDLQLSGHTHGGQVRLPFLGALVTGSLYGRAFQRSGRYELGKLTLYISRGIGMEGAGAPRVRFLCPPEIIDWEIKGK